jgi:ABC-type multidrug transport system permease subunit
MRPPRFGRARHGSRRSRGVVHLHARHGRVPLVPGHFVPLRVLGYFVAVMLAGGVGLQALLEAKGTRFVGMTAIFVALLPLMAGTVLGSISNRMIPLASWLVGISPVSLPVYASGTLLSLAELPREAARAVPRAFQFWLFVSLLVTAWLLVRLRAGRQSMARRILKAPAENEMRS